MGIILTFSTPIIYFDLYSQINITVPDLVLNRDYQYEIYEDKNNTNYSTVLIIKFTYNIQQIKGKIAILRYN